MENLETMVISLSVFGSAVLIVFVLAKYNYLIKKAYAERGIEASPRRINYLEVGCIVLGIGLGVGLSSLFTLLTLPEDTMDLLIYATILIGGAVGLIAAHLIRNKLEKNSAE